MQKWYARSHRGMIPKAGIKKLTLQEMGAIDCDSPLREGDELWKVRNAIPSLGDPTYVDQLIFDDFMWEARADLNKWPEEDRSDFWQNLCGEFAKHIPEGHIYGVSERAMEIFIEEASRVNAHGKTSWRRLYAALVQNFGFIVDVSTFKVEVGDKGRRAKRARLV